MEFSHINIICNIYLFLTIYNANCQMIFPDNRLAALVSNLAKQTENGYNNVDELINFNNSNELQNNILIEKGLSNYTTEISNGINSFMLNLNKAIISKQKYYPEENIVFSPLSVAGALSLLVLGSVGQTYEEIAQVLQFFNGNINTEDAHKIFGVLLANLMKQNNYNEFSQNLSYASAVFLQNNYPINKKYEDDIKSVYKSDIKHVDFKNEPFKTQSIINRWVADRTNGRIQNILAEIPPIETTIIIGNALYFRAEWEKYFLDGLTERKPFTPNKNYPENSITVEMMANVGHFSYYKSEEIGCIVLGLPYKGNKTTMYAIKPIDSRKMSLNQLLMEMTTTKLEFLIKNAEKQDTIVRFPKMRLTSSSSMKSILQDMGIKAVFSKTKSNLGKLSSFVFNNDDRLIFTRFTDESLEDNCEDMFKDASKTNCTKTEIINGKNVRVVYKRIGDSIGRRIIKRNAVKKINKRQNLNYINPGLYVDEIIHKVDISITETGTEAAASTAVFITRDGRRPIFSADEPFYMLIRDEQSGLPLFSSVIYKPTPNY